MRWIQLISAGLCLAAAAQCVSPQAIFQVQNQREPDLVDLMVEEARERNILLDHELKPSTVETKDSSFSWSQCGGDEIALHVESIELTPESPQRGHNLTVHGKATLSTRADVSCVLRQFGTYIDLSVRVGFLRIFSQRIDVCEALRENEVEVQCPAAPGHYDVSHTVFLPSQVPPGRFTYYPAKYSVHVEGQTHEEKPLTCMDIVVSFSVFDRVRSWLGW